MSLFRTKSVDHLIRASQNQHGLKRALGPLDLTLLGIGAVIGTGIFVLIGKGALTAGPALMLSFVLAAVACILAALCYAEFASTIPAAGSIYTYTYATMGELAAWIIGWDLMLEYGLATSAVSAGWSGYVQAFLAGIGLHLPAALTAAPGSVPGVDTWFNLPAFIIMMIITSVVAFGIRESARFNNVMVALKVVVVVLVIVVGARHVDTANWTPFAPYGTQGIFKAGAVMFFAFLGFDAVTNAAEEARNPARSLPIGLLGSISICTLLYVAVAAVMTGILPYQRFAEGIDHPVALALQLAGEHWVGGFITLGAVVGMTTVILVMLYGQTRITFAMSRDGLLPKKLSELHPTHNTPFFNTWVIGIVFGLIAALLPLDFLAELINIGTLAAFTLVALAVLILRRTRPDLPRGFRCPGSPYIPVLTMAVCIFLMIQLDPLTWICFVVWSAIGLAVYFLYARRRSNLHTTS
ncbi:amino acid permease [Uliginosibacterium sp. sgz301328]|uniref:amino acid permease n=1 Tax=Uliginosibacterium sp. sgz301328 TaxID=3243764 RepID=UPI00359DAB37